MTDDLKKYYEERFETFSTQGWKDFIEDIKALQNPLLNIKSIKTEQELHFRKGQLDILDWVLGLKEMSEKAFDTLQTEE